MNQLLNIIICLGVVMGGVFIISVNPIIGSTMAIIGFGFIFFMLHKLNQQTESIQDHRLAKKLVSKVIQVFGDNKDAEEYLKRIAQEKGIEFPSYAQAIWEEWETYHQIKNELKQ